MRLILILLLSAFCTAQSVITVLEGGTTLSEAPYPAPKLTETRGFLSLLPHPFVEGGLNTNGDGYQPFAGNLGAGLDMETSHFILNAEGFYDFMRKTNDNDQVVGEKGRVRSVNGVVFYRFRSGASWFVGGGAGWEEASMTTYMKSSWTPQLGVGHDFASEKESWRFQALYLRDENEVVRYPSLVQFTPGPGQLGLSRTCSLCGNGRQGIAVSSWYPSPSTSHHFFVHWMLTPIWFHETVTDPYNLPLTQGQKSQRAATGSFDVDFIYLF